MSEAGSELSPQEQELLLEVGRRLEEHLPALAAGWDRALDDLLAAEGEPARGALRQESLSAAYTLLSALSSGRASDALESGRAYGATMAMQGLGHTLLGAWLAALRQGLLTVLAQAYADDPQLDRAIIAFSKLYAIYMIRVSESFSGRQQSLLLEQQEALRNAYEEAQRRVVELEVLNEVGRAIGSIIDLDELMQLIYRQTSRLMDTTNFLIALCDWERGLLHFEIRIEEGEALPRVSRGIDQGLTGHVACTGQPLFLPHGTEAFRQEHGIDRIGREALSWLGVPMFVQDRVIGVIAVQSLTQEAAHDEGHLRILSTIASQAAVAVQNACLYAEARRRAEEMEALYRLGATAALHLSVEEILQSIYDQASVVMDTTAFFVALYDRDTDEIAFEMVYDNGVREASSRAKKSERGGLTGWVLDHGETLLIRDWENEAPAELRRIAVQDGEAALSWLGVPMIIRGETIGVIAAQSYRPNAFDEHHGQVLEMIAHQAAAAVENIRLYQEARRRFEEIEALYRIGMASASRLTFEEVMESIYAQASVVMDTGAFYVALYDRETDEIRADLIYDRGERMPPYRTKKSERGGAIGWIMDRGEALLIRDWEEDAPEDLRRVALDMEEEPVRSWLSVPLVALGEVVGVITTQSYEPGAFDEHDRRVLEMIAHQAAPALANARLYQEAQRRVAQLSALQQIGLKLAATTDLSGVLDAVAASALELLQANDVLIFLHEEGRDEFTLGAGLRDSGEHGLLVPMPRKDGLTARVAHSGEMVIIEDAAAHPLYADQIEQARGLRSIASVPLIRAGQVLGVLNVSYAEPHRFTGEETRLLQTFADQAAVAVGNARLFQQTQAVLQELQDTTATQSTLLGLIQDLSTPIVPLLRGVLLMPLVGSIDSERGRQILERLLRAVELQRAQIVLVDITGVPVVDTAVAQILLQAVQAVQLLGGEAVLVGIRPEVAQTLVGLGVNLAGIATRSDLQGGLLYAMRRVGQKAAARIGSSPGG